jgi:dTMP kinase
VSNQADGVQALGLRDRAQWRGVLRTPFRNLWFSNLTSSLGDWVGIVAILALTEQILDSPRLAAFAMSGIMIARVVPTMILGPVAGVFVDRWDRRRLMITTHIGRGLVLAMVPFAGSVWALILATLLLEIQSSLFIPAKDAVIPSLVGRNQLVQANQLNLLAAYGTFPLGGVLFAVAVAGAAWIAGGRSEFLLDRPAAVAIWLNALTFVLAAIFITRIPRNALARNGSTQVQGPGAWQELKEGFRFIVTHPLVRELVVGVMGAFLAAGAVIAVGQLFAVILNAGQTGFGILVAAVGTGLLLGILSTGWMSRHWRKERLFAPGIGTAGIALMVTALMPRLDLASIPAFIMGFGAGVAFLTGYTILQERTSDAIRGRTFAAFNTGVRMALFASLILGPLTVGLIGPEAQGLIDENGGLIGDGPMEPGRSVGFVPYAIGGVRITLLLAGVVALAGSAYSWWGIRKALNEPRHLDLGAANGGSHPGRGLFVTFEGGEGAGKSTQVRLLRAAIEREGHDALVTREPGGTEIGERLRALVLDPARTEMADRTEALLYAAARAQHVEEIIRPALEKGQVVICDRFIDSSVVYQGIARGLGATSVSELNRWATADLMPDLVVVLDIAAEEGLHRAGAQPDRLEAAGVGFHRKVNTAFRDRAVDDPERYLVLDARLAVEELHARIRDAVLARLAARQEAPPVELEEAGVAEPDDDDQVPPPTVPLAPDDLDDEERDA